MKQGGDANLARDHGGLVIWKEDLDFGLWSWTLDLDLIVMNRTNAKSVEPAHPSP